MAELAAELLANPVIEEFSVRAQLIPPEGAETARQPYLMDVFTWRNSPVRPEIARPHDYRSLTRETFTI